MTTPKTPLWADVEQGQRFPRLEGDDSYDVVVVGGGVTGITAATHLVRAGKKVALLEMQRVLDGETGHTTSHLTQLIDRRYHTVAKRFGEEAARLVADSHRLAIDNIEADCDPLPNKAHFRRVPMFQYAETGRDLREIEKEVDACLKAGMEASFTHEVPLPFPTRGALRLARQAEVHPREYLQPMVDALAARGCDVFEHTRVVGVHDGAPCRVETETGTVRADRVIVAAYAPFQNRFFLQTKLEPLRSYALAARLRTPQATGLFYDNREPYHYVRTQQTTRGEYLIVGGEDHKVGTEDDTGGRYEKLEEWTRERFDVEAVTHRWSGQILEPIDGLPFIGRNSASSNVFIGTGYSGNGITWGVVAGELLSDLALGRDNPYAELYRATRIKPLAQAKDFMSFNAGFPYHLLVDRLRRSDGASPEELPPGEGKVMRVDGRRLAVYRDEAGAVHALSPVCTHMGCHVAWNPAEKSWDCPCHGGRYSCEGRVINGPPVRDLKPVSLDADDAEPSAGPGVPGAGRQGLLR